MTTTVPQADQPRLRSVVDVCSRGRLRRVLMLFGPAFVASVAYVDPGNFATNFAAGSRYGYQLVWVIVLANLVAILVQYLSAKVGLATDQTLPELCRGRFSRGLNVLLWLQAEVVAMATDLAEFVGAAIGLHLVFGMPLLPAGLVAAVVAYVVLALHRQGRRRFEAAVVALLVLVGAGMGYLLLASRQSYSGITAGLVPRLGGSDSLQLSVGIVGATVMPHAVYLHSALQKRRVLADDLGQRRTLLTYNFADCVVGLGIAGLVNVAMLCVGASLKGGSDGDLESIQHELATEFGGLAALAFAVALLASGLSSSSVGTYAGQVVMAGFVNLRIPLALRRLVTMVPALVVLAVAPDTSSVLVLSQILLSFGIPFALVPLLLVTGDRSVMGGLANTRVTRVLILVVTGVVVCLNATLVLEAAL